RADEAVRQDADGFPESRSAADLEVGRMLGVQHACPDRKGKLLSERRWQADAGEEEPGAAGPELFPTDAVTRTIAERLSPASMTVGYAWIDSSTPRSSEATLTHPTAQFVGWVSVARALSV